MNTLEGYLEKHPPALVYDALKAFYRSSRTELPQDVERVFGGYGITEVLLKTKSWEKLADQGYAAAQIVLSVAYSGDLEGFPKDEKRAREFCELAAAQGYAPAQYNLGRMYKDGLSGLQKNPIKAGKFYEKALAAGLTQAKYGIADLLLQKVENLSLAYAYLHDVMAQVPKMKDLAAEKLQFLKDLQRMQEEAAEKYEELQEKEQAQMKMGRATSDSMTHDEGESAQVSERDENSTAAGTASGTAAPAYAIFQDTHACEKTSTVSSEGEEEQTVSEGEEAQTSSFASAAPGTASAESQKLSTPLQKKSSRPYQSKAYKGSTKREETLRAVQQLKAAEQDHTQKMDRIQEEYHQKPRDCFADEALQTLSAIFRNVREAVQKEKEIRNMLKSPYFFPGEVEYKETKSGFVIVFHNHKTGLSRSAGSHRAHRGGHRIDGSLDFEFIRDLKDTLDRVYDVRNLIPGEAA